jgi:UDP-N-acetylglucosamine 1-carboxyvinyltransferase
MGCGVREDCGRIRLRSEGRLHAAPPVVTAPYPGFPTDAQPLLLAAGLRAAGTGVFTENVFSDRFRHAEELRRLGARIRTEGRTAYVTGVEKLVGCGVTATDLRGGAALILAGLCAEGETLVRDDGHVERGYEDLDGQLRQLGATVEKRSRMC